MHSDDLAVHAETDRWSLRDNQAWRATISPGTCSSTRLHELALRLELYLPYAPLPGGGGILPAVSGSGASGGCRPVLLGGVDLSMSAAVQPPVATLPTNLTSGPIAAHNSLHHTSGGLALPLGAAAGPPVMMPRPPPGAMPPLGPTLPPTHQDEDLADAAPNQDVLLALLARNKNLEGKWKGDIQENSTEDLLEVPMIDRNIYYGYFVRHQNNRNHLFANFCITCTCRKLDFLSDEYERWVERGNMLMRKLRDRMVFLGRKMIESNTHSKNIICQRHY